MAMWPCIKSYTVYAVLDYIIIIIIILEQLLLLLQRLVVLRMGGGWICLLAHTPTTTTTTTPPSIETTSNAVTAYTVSHLVSREFVAASSRLYTTSMYLSDTFRRPTTYRIPRSWCVKLYVRRRSWYTTHNVSCIYEFALYHSAAVCIIYNIYITRPAAADLTIYSTEIICPPPSFI